VAGSLDSPMILFPARESDAHIHRRLGHDRNGVFLDQILQLMRHQGARSNEEKRRGTGLSRLPSR
jgi:hypothetical protein